MEKVEKQLELIRRGTAEIFPEEELIAKLERDKPLRVKLGIDPSTKDIHLGHTVVLHKLRQFQELGHKAVLIIGDGTGLVGDPSGRDKTRPQLTPEEIEENAKTYLEQVGKVLVMSDEVREEIEGKSEKGEGRKENAEYRMQNVEGRKEKVISDDRLEIRWNGNWFRKMSFFDLVRLASKITVARVLERDDFAERFKKKVPISLHELIYPVMQGWDSVKVESDIELGGTDQKYNLLVGRDLQRDSGQEPQICITVPLLIGTDGKQKMSKSYDNYIGVTEPAKTMFDKILSIPDSLAEDYFILLTDEPMEKFHWLLGRYEGISCPSIPKWLLDYPVGPLKAKFFLAWRIVARYHSDKIADAVLYYSFGDYERRKKISAEIEEGKARAKAEVLEELKRREALREAGSALAEADLAQKAVISQADLKNGKIWIVRLVKATGFVKSNSQARQKIIEGAVTLNGEKITDPDAELSVKEGDIVKLGKKRLAVVSISQ